MTAKKEEEKGKGLYGKLLDIMSEVSRVEKRGWNEFHHYHYVMESDLIEMVRAKLTERGILLLPSVDAFQHEDTLTTLSMRFTFIDTENGERHEAPWVGTGSDKGDKGAYKALTGALKYFLMKSFLIPSGDDPEGDVKTDRRVERHDQANATPSSDVPKCPDCSGAMWDNRETKTGRQPDFKCKDRQCNKAVWVDAVPSSGGESSASVEVTALREQIKKAMQALNDAGDDAEWTVERVNRMVKEQYDGKITAALGAPELTDLARMFSERLEDLRSKRADFIAAIEGEAAAPSVIEEWIGVNAPGRTIHQLTLKELKNLDAHVSIPF